MILNFVLVFLFGVVLTLVVTYRISKGELKIYIPDDRDEEPYLYVELDRPVSHLVKKKYVLFRVNTKRITTHK